MTQTVDRLGPLDLMFVWPEQWGWSQDIGALAILDGRALPRVDGRLDLDALRGHVTSRLHLVPRFRQRLLRPRFGLGWPLWVDASPDLAHHVRSVAVGAPADEARLLRVVEELRGRRLDPTRPLWEMWFLTGLADEQVGLFVKVHHSIADGVSGIAVIGAFVDASTAVPEVVPPPWDPSPPPSTPQLFADNIRRRLQELRRPLTHLLHPLRTIRAARQGWPALREAFFEEQAPRTSLNTQGIGWHRRLAMVATDLDAVRAIARDRDSTVNDVLMAMVAGGLRDLLISRGESVDDLVLRAAVPVALRTGDADASRGNADGMMMVPLPVGEPDPGRRLARITAETRRRKRTSRPEGGTLFRNGVIQRAFLRMAHRQRLMNTYVANVPGPPMTLFLAGAPIRELFAVVPLLGNVSLGVGALSYAGQFTLTVVADRDLCPDTAVFVAGIRRALDDLGAATLAHASDRRHGA